MRAFDRECPVLDAVLGPLQGPLRLEPCSGRHRRAALLDRAVGEDPCDYQYEDGLRLACWNELRGPR